MCHSVFECTWGDKMNISIMEKHFIIDYDSLVTGSHCDILTLYYGQDKDQRHCQWSIQCIHYYCYHQPWYNFPALAVIRAVIPLEGTRYQCAQYKPLSQIAVNSTQSTHLYYRNPSLLHLFNSIPEVSFLFNPIIKVIYSNRIACVI